MHSGITSTSLAGKIWFQSALALTIGIFLYFLVTGEVGLSFLVLIASILVTPMVSLPAFLVLLLFLPLILKIFKTYKQRTATLIILFLFISLIYGSGVAIISDNPFTENTSLQSFFLTTGIACIAVFAATILAFFNNHKYIKTYFSSTNQITHTMNENPGLRLTEQNQNVYSNKLWIKGLITGCLILLMLIPTAFVANLVEERQARQQEVKHEVSSKWAGGQSITFPYLYIPYNFTVISNGEPSVEKRSFLILPDELDVTGSVSTEERKRSIYSVLLYNSTLNAKGNFKIEVPGNIDTSAIDWAGSKICFGISDFKGIQQKITVKVNDVLYDLSAGLPTHEIDTIGLSAPVNLTAGNNGKELSFDMPLRIKGSDQLHFVPLAGNSQFSLRSNWNSPSFDGNTLPAERNLNDNGFEANWSFNKANLPFNTTLENFNFKKEDYAFGVSLLQPTDQYAKTLRCVKYALLFIGLTFSLFFIVEIMQKKPFHPVQYVLVGLALIVFYTLLLSISEFLLFDLAYFIAAIATVSLIAFYAKTHFKSLKTAGVFAGVIGAIYGFIFVLIRLEDTALLVGSIGLFAILALAMYASRKINWYGHSLAENTVV
ncbi:MAG TPA: cell envelope integrity protein CreD [Parafilimonas sp.]|nr:cell envelope integrity protein CreD [Parafilimonas sp.]